MVNLFIKIFKKKVETEFVCKHEYVGQVGFTNWLRCYECDELLNNPNFPSKDFDWIRKI